MKWGLIVIWLFNIGALVQADEVTIDIEGGICGDCCTMKLFTKGVRNVIGADKGKTIVTLEYDPAVTTPQKIVQDLKKVGKKVKVISTSKDDSTSRNWVKPLPSPGTRHEDPQ